MSADCHCLFSILSPTFSTRAPSPPSATWGRVRPWWRGPPYRGNLSALESLKTDSQRRFEWHLKTLRQYLPLTFTATITVRVSKSTDAEQWSRYSEQMIRLSNPGSEKRFFFSDRPNRLFGQRIFLFNGHWSSFFFSGAERLGRHVHHSPPPCVQLQNE